MKTINEYNIQFQKEWMNTVLSRIEKELAEKNTDWYDGFLRGQRAIAKLVQESLLEEK